jgi:hypothetical protein
MARSLLLGCLLLALVAAPCLCADKPIISVLDLTVDQVSVAEMKTLISLLSSALFQTDKYTVIDTSERDRILKEIEFSASECTDEGCQLEIGKLLSAEYIVVGRLGMIGKRYVVSLKLLETSTSRTVGTADGIYPELEKVLDDLEAIAARLSGTKVAEKPAETKAAAPPTAPAPATAAKPAAAEKPEVAAKEVAPAKPRVSLAPKTIAAIGCAGGSVVCAGLGAVLMVGGVQYLNGPVADAYDLYIAEPQGSAAYDTLYQSYADEFAVSQSKLIPGTILVGGAVALGVASAVLFILPQKTAAAIPVAQAVVTPRGYGLQLGIRIRW